MRQKIAAALFAALFAAACLCALFVHVPEKIRAGTVVCNWESGAREENYADMLSSLTGLGEGEIFFERAGERGSVAAGEAYGRVHDVLSRGGLLELLTLDTEGLSPLERAALYLTYGDVSYYAGGSFFFDGRSVRRTERKGAGRVVLLDGGMSGNFLADMGASELELRAEADFAAGDLDGCGAISVTAEAPYLAAGDAVFIETPGGRRLLSVLPQREEVFVPDCLYCDKGALSAAAVGARLDLPFIGAAKSPLIEEDGSLAWMYGTTNEAPMYGDAASVKVRGGVIRAYAFRGFRIGEIDLCGLEEGDISAQAVLGVTSLELVHTPRADILLEGSFSRTLAPCGCTVYRRV